MNHHDRINILWSLSIIACASLLFAGRIPQDASYHQFADTRSIVGLSNFWNVLSNLPFLLVGVYGLWRVRDLQAEYKQDYQTLCIGIFLVSLGSAYYHSTPNTLTLLWDRLPMTIAFMALFAMLLKERVLTNTTIPISGITVALGIVSVIYWYWTETRGVGDLRAYALVQFLPMLLIPAILYLFDSQYLNGKFLVIALVYYVVAKLFEQLDKQIFELFFLSGHALKHLAASIAALYIILAVPVTHRH